MYCIKMIKELADAQKGRERAELFQREAEDQLLGYKEREAGHIGENGKVEALLRLEREKGFALEDSISCF